MTDATPDIREAVLDDDGVLTLYLQAAPGVVSEVKLGAQAQGLVLQALLGSSLDPLAPLSRRFEPMGLSRFRLHEEVGISFLLSPHVGIHFLLDRSLAEVLQDLLVTFDDVSSWRPLRAN